MGPLEKQQAFHKELKELLLKYKAEIEIEDDYTHYRSQVNIVVNFDYDESLFEEHKTGCIPQLNLGTYETYR